MAESILVTKALASIGTVHHIKECDYSFAPVIEVTTAGKGT